MKETAAARPGGRHRAGLRALPAPDLPFLVLGYLMKVVMFRLRGFGGYYGQGFQEALKVIGKIEKPKFRLKNLPNYVFIQLWLVVGLFQYIVYRAQRALKIT